MTFSTLFFEKENVLILSKPRDGASRRPLVACSASLCNPEGTQTSGAKAAEAFLPLLSIWPPSQDRSVRAGGG